MTEEQLTARQERAAERLLEDESLTGGLSDEQARALIRWAAQMAARAAAPERSDAELDAALRAIRSAVRHAAASPGDGAALVALAAQHLAGRIAPPAAAPAPRSARPAVCITDRRLSLMSHCP